MQFERILQNKNERWIQTACHLHTNLHESYIGMCKKLHGYKLHLNSFPVGVDSKSIKTKPPQAFLMVENITSNLQAGEKLQQISEF